MLKTLFVLAFLAATSVSGLKNTPIAVNEHLETSVSCSASSECSLDNAHCNQNGNCQCKWQSRPTSSKNNGVLDRCETAWCTYPGLCMELYRDGNATCTSGGEVNSCICQAGFDFNEERQQCEYYEPNVIPLGGSCKGANECGGGVTCSGEGFCQCAVGWIPENNITCKALPCDSDTFCRGRVTPNSRCSNPGSDSSRCDCFGDYVQSSNAPICVPRARKIGESCTLNDYGFHCGSMAGCSVENGKNGNAVGKCKCAFDALPKPENSMDCQQIRRCEANLDCMAADMNAECDKNNHCRCRDGYSVDRYTLACKKHFRLDLSWILLIVVVVGSLLALTIYLVVKKGICKKKQTPLILNEKPPINF